MFFTFLIIRQTNLRTPNNSFHHVNYATAQIFSKIINCGNGDRYPLFAQQGRILETPSQIISKEKSLNSEYAVMSKSPKKITRRK